MTAYRAMDRSRSAVMRSCASIVLTSPNSCITLSSCRRSSCPCSIGRSTHHAQQGSWRRLSEYQRKAARMWQQRCKAPKALLSGHEEACLQEEHVLGAIAAMDGQLPGPLL